MPAMRQTSRARNILGQRMDEHQFVVLIKKLEEICCSLIDVENVIQAWINLQPKPETFAEGLQKQILQKGVFGERF